MATTLEQGSQILFETIDKNLRHQDYVRVNKIAEDYTTYATGVGIEKKLKRFNGRENETDFKQRVQLTITNVVDIFSRCVKPLYKVGRTTANIKMDWLDADSAKTSANKNKLIDAGKYFWGKKDVASYVGQRMADLDSTDPNAFMVVEFEGDVDPTKPSSKAKPYPFEVNSKEAIDYKYVNQKLKYLTVLNQDKMVDGKNIFTVAEKYYMYLDNETITATQIHFDNVVKYTVEKNLTTLNNFNQLLSSTASKNKIKYLYFTSEEDPKSKRYFIVEVFEHKIGFCPAIRFGSVYDITTRNRTCIPLVHPAQCYFEKSIKAMSEFDLTNCLHTFPQKIVYSDPCAGEAYEGGHLPCQNGTRLDGVTCGACKGTGFKGHTGAQDVIQVRMPKDLSNIFPLENLIAYKSPPLDLLEFQKKFGFYELGSLANRAVYNSDAFIQQGVNAPQTATGERIDLDSVYDTLMPFSDSSSEMYEHIYMCIASLIDIRTNFVIDHKYPTDFKMESFNALLEQLQKANLNGVPSYIRKAINKKLTNKIYIDDPNEIIRIETKSKYFPFDGKTDNEINFIFANDLTTHYNKTFYAHFDLIFSEIEYEQGLKGLNFYNIVEAQQRVLIDEKIKEIILKISDESSENTAVPFGEQNALSASVGEDNALSASVGKDNALRSSVGGLTGMIEIAKAVASGLYDLDAAVALVSDRFGISEEQARTQLGTPTISGDAALEKVTKLV